MYTLWIIGLFILRELISAELEIIRILDFFYCVKWYIFLSLVQGYEELKPAATVIERVSDEDGIINNNILIEDRNNTSSTTPVTSTHSSRNSPVDRTSTNVKPPYSYVALIAMAIQVMMLNILSTIAHLIRFNGRKVGNRKFYFQVFK